MLKLIREIRSKLGKLHFKRWRILETRWGNIYIHYIAEADQDRHMHDHPWDFMSFILWGGYTEVVEKVIWKTATEIESMEYSGNDTHIGSIIYHQANDFHQIRILKRPTWTLVFTGPRKRQWGYLFVTDWEPHRWIDNVTYRKMKNEKQFL